MSTCDDTVADVPAPAVPFFTTRNPAKAPTIPIRSTRPNMLTTPIPPAIPGVIDRELQLEESESEPGSDDDGVVEAQSPVEFPQALHHEGVSATAKLVIPAAKSLHEIVVSDWPKRGYN